MPKHRIIEENNHSFSARTRTFCNEPYRRVFFFFFEIKRAIVLGSQLKTNAMLTVCVVTQTAFTKQLNETNNHSIPYNTSKLPHDIRSTDKSLLASCVTHTIQAYRWTWCRTCMCVCEREREVKFYDHYNGLISMLTNVQLCEEGIPLSILEAYIFLPLHVPFTHCIALNISSYVFGRFSSFSGNLHCTC